MFSGISTLLRNRFTKWTLASAIAILGSGLTDRIQAQSDRIDLVRTEQGKFSRDIVYQLHTDQWQQPVVLTKNSTTDDFSPAILRIDNDRALVIWKELVGLDASNLLFSFIHFKTDGSVESVSDSQTLKTKTAHQASPTLLRDLQGRIWGFWVGFNGKDDDIYFSRFVDNRWMEERRLFAQDNDVPDLRPTARLNVAGVPELRWRQFSFDKGAYIDVYAVLESENEDGARWSDPEEYVINPLEKSPRFPENFALPDAVSAPKSVAINYYRHPNVVLHWDKLYKETGVPVDENAQTE